MSESRSLNLTGLDEVRIEMDNLNGPVPLPGNLGTQQAAEGNARTVYVSPSLILNNNVVLTLSLNKTQRMRDAGIPAEVEVAETVPLWGVRGRW